MVTIETTKTLKYKYFNRFSKFVLIGNCIDGFVTVGIEEFKDFEEVKKRLKKILETIEFSGEWNLKFFEVPDNYKIEILYGYYRVPNAGNFLFELTPSRNIGDIIQLHIDDSMIHFHFLSEYIEIEETEEDELYDVQVFEDFLTINLLDNGVKLIPETEKTYKEKYITDDESYLERKDVFNYYLMGDGF